MKKFIVLIIIVFISSSVFAQNANEWLKQKKTQKKYLLQQIIALQQYAGYLEKGYSIAKKGLATIKNTKQGDYTLHNDFISSLSIISPQVKKYTKVPAIILMQLAIAKQITKTIASCKSQDQFTTNEVKYLQDVFDKLSSDCLECMNELFVVLTDKELQLKDNERLERIDMLYTDMQDKYAFTQSFSSSAIGLSVQRLNERNEVIVSRRLNEIQ